MTERTVLYGIGVSAGTASGPIAVVTPAVGIDEHEPVSYTHLTLPTNREV